MAAFEGSGSGDGGTGGAGTSKEEINGIISVGVAEAIKEAIS